MSRSLTPIIDYMVSRVAEVTTLECKLPKAGREILIKSVAPSIPPYLMSMFSMPKSICATIERFIAGF